MTGSRSFGYEEAVRALREALTFGVNPSLDTIAAMTEELGRPQDSFASIQVTGTNGKSSVVRLVAAILEAHGVNSAAYTSPELHSYTERVACGGVPVTEAMFATGVAEALEAAGRAGVTPTEFEILTAAALWLFRECGVEVAVLEVGMGGRWDATSVVEPRVSVVTGVALDHSAHLGDTREEIATDKAHIIKPASVAILGPGTIGVEKVFHAHVAAVGATAPVRAVRSGSMASPVAERETVRYVAMSPQGSPDAVTRVDVTGTTSTYSGIQLHAPAYQAANVATAVAAAEAYLGRSLDADTVRNVVEGMAFPGRFQVLDRDPWLVGDVAHNPDGAAALARAITAAWPDPDARPAIVLGVLEDKDAAGILFALAPVASRFICVTPGSPRALGADRLAEVVERVTGERPEIASSVAEAVASLRATGTDVLVTGSTRVVAEATA